MHAEHWARKRKHEQDVHLNWKQMPRIELQSVRVQDAYANFWVLLVSEFGSFVVFLLSLFIYVRCIGHLQQREFMGTLFYWCTSYVSRKAICSAGEMSDAACMRKDFDWKFLFKSIATLIANIFSIRWNNCRRRWIVCGAQCIALHHHHH